MQRGIDVHDILDKFFDHVDKVVKPETEYIEILKMLAGEKYDEFKVYLENFARLELLRRARYEKHGRMEWYKPMRREKKWFAGDYNCIIDRVDYIPNNGFVLADYKTGTFYPKEWRKARFELTFYAYLFARNYHRPIWKIAVIPLKYINFNRLNGIYPYQEVVTQEHYKEMFRVVEWIKTKIAEEEFQPKKGNCFYCDYKKICDKLKEKKKRKDKLENWEIDNE